MEQKVEKQASLESVPVKRLKRELKYQGTILKMYEDTVEVNGHQAKWDFIHHDGAAAVLPVTEDGKILMVRQYRNALDRYTLELSLIHIFYRDQLHTCDQVSLALGGRHEGTRPGWGIFNEWTGKWNAGFIGVADCMRDTGIWDSGYQIGVGLIAFGKHTTAVVPHFLDVDSFVCLLYTSRCV